MSSYIFLFFILQNDVDFFNVRINSDSNPKLPFHNEEQIVVNPLDSLNLVAVWRDFRLGYRQIGIGISFDGGVTWEDRLLEGSGFPYDSDPALTTDAEGNIYLVTVSFKSVRDSNALVVFKSEDGGRTFNRVGYAAFSEGSTFEDKEMMACDRTDSDYRGSLYVSWTRFYSPGWSPRIVCAVSRDGGETWSSPSPVNDEGSRVQWSVPCVGKDGTVYVAWVDMSSHSIKLDYSVDGGETWVEDRFAVDGVAALIYIDDWIGAFSYPAMDADITDGPYGGNLYMAYMNYGENGSTDIYFIKSSDYGETWSEPVVISGEDIPDNDQFHPWLVVDNIGVIHVIFYDQRNGIEDDLVDLYYTYSEDGGETWSEPERITQVSSKPRTKEPPFLELFSNGEGETPPGYKDYILGEIYGEYIGLAAWNHRFFPVWTDCREDGVENVYFAYRKPYGISLDEYSRARLELKGDLLLVELPDNLKGDLNFTIYDLKGSRVFPEKRVRSFSGRLSINVSNLPSGVYFLQLGKGDHLMIRKRFVLLRS